MIDYNEHDYVKVGHYSNVSVELPKDRACKAYERVHLCSFMEQLIYKVALQHPEWTIIGKDARWQAHSDTWRVADFNLYEDNEYIGRFTRRGYHEEQFQYELHNERISKARQRHGGKATKDLKKALKHIDEWFKPKTLQERLYKALEDMRSTTQTSEWRATRHVNDLIGRMLPAVTTYLVSNMSEVRPILESFGAPAAALDALPEKFETARGLWQVKASRETVAGTTVVLMGDKYMLIPDNDPTNPQIVTASQLDPAMSGKIGVLKIFDKEHEAIECVGMRISPTTFYIVP